MKTLGRIAALIYVGLALSPLVFFALYSATTFAWQMGWQPDWREAVIAPERANELAKKGLMEQVVTFRTGPVGLRKDPVTNEVDLYAIGVGQTTLEEARPSGMFNMIDSPGIAQGPVRYASSQPVTGQFNNLLIFEPRSGATTKVFSTRLAISTFSYGSGPNHEVVIVLASGKDSDKDGVLSSGDMQDAFVFSLKDRSLHRVAGLSGNPVEIIHLANQDYVVIRAVQDDNGDGKADDSWYGGRMPEQNLLFRVDLRSYAATPLVSRETIAELQRTLEARPQADKGAKP